MNILIVNSGMIPVTLYGGTERVIWGLGKELNRLGHRVSYLVKEGSSCHFAEVQYIDESMPIIEQINKDYDLIHFNFTPKNLEKLNTPYLITMHGNADQGEKLDKNTVFVSKNHANRHGSHSFVYNGLDWDEYLPPQLNAERSYFHFLGKAAWRAKNVVGAIDIIKASKSERLKVLGGVRFNIKMGLRFTLSPKINFEGMVGGEKKYRLLNHSKGLIFPVRWHEPFGLALIESLYYGCPVFGTPYGSLPEIINDEVGYLSNKKSELTEAISHWDQYSTVRCYEYARDVFNHQKMTESYLKLYQKVINNQELNDENPMLEETSDSKFLPWN